MATRENRLTFLSFSLQSLGKSPETDYGLFSLLENNLISFSQGLEGYSQDPEFDQNTVRDSRKRKVS